MVSLADGSFHVICNLTTAPCLDASSPEVGLSSKTLSKVARGVFVKVEEDPIQRVDVNCINGMSSYDDDSFYLWIHE